MPTDPPNPPVVETQPMVPLTPRSADAPSIFASANRKYLRNSVSRHSKGRTFETLLDQTVRMVAEGLEAELAKVLEYIPAEKRLLMRAGVGWDPGLVGTASIGADLESLRDTRCGPASR